MIDARLKRLREGFAEARIEALLVQKPENRLYLSGFTGSSGILAITAEQAFLFTDFRYTEQAEEQAPAFQVLNQNQQVVASIANVLQENKITRVGFESDFVTFEQHMKLAEGLTGLALVPVSGFVEGLRRIKDGSEIKLLQQSVSIADQAFQKVLTLLRPGVREKEIAAEIEYQMRRLGAQGPAFDTIVASGSRGSLPHGIASDKEIAPGEMVIMDFGAVYEGYHSDLSRTVAVGKVSNEQKRIYEVVLRAQKEAIAALKAGMTGGMADAVARNVITADGYGECFGHSLGHGVGLAIHEEPRLAPKDDVVLEQGMTFTVEPGIYLAKKGGVRIEDVVVMAENGGQVLTGAVKDLIIL